ncbi:winged helix-turn-helix transcriptional regulator [Bradyrhizobium sp. USDA 4486]
MKAGRPNVLQENCAITKSLRTIGDWWSLLIIRNAFEGAQRFGEFEKGLGIAKNMLSARLKKLVAKEIFRLEPIQDTAFHRYVLTEKGKKLAVILVALWKWGAEFCFEPGEREHNPVDIGPSAESRFLLEGERRATIGPASSRSVSKPITPV